MTSTRSPSPELGDVVTAALRLVGITQERVSEWLGKPCRCRKRAVRLNRLHRWAKRVATGKERDPRGWIVGLMGMAEVEGVKST